MPGFGVIADVSETLRTVLNDGLSSLTPAPPPLAELHDLQGAIPTNPPRLTIFLYEIVEDATTRNRPPVREFTPAGVVSHKPPCTLLLRYLLTPFSGDRLTDHRIIGRAIQVLYDNPIFAGPDLQGAPAPDGLVGSDQALKTTMSPLTLEERTRVWDTVQQPYRLSLTYEVRVANIDPEESIGGRLVRSRIIERAEAERALS